MGDVRLLEEDDDVAAGVRRAVELRRHHLVAEILAPACPGTSRRAASAAGRSGWAATSSARAPWRGRRCDLAPAALKTPLPPVWSPWKCVSMTRSTPRPPAFGFSPSTQICAVFGNCVSTTTTALLPMYVPMVPPWPLKMPTLPRTSANEVCGVGGGACWRRGRLPEKPRRRPGGGERERGPAQEVAACAVHGQLRIDEVGRECYHSRAPLVDPGRRSCRHTTPASRPRPAAVDIDAAIRARDEAEPAPTGATHDRAAIGQCRPEAGTPEAWSVQPGGAVSPAPRTSRTPEYRSVLE